MNHNLQDTYNDVKQALGAFDNYAVGTAETACRRLEDELAFLDDIESNEHADQIANLKLGLAYQIVAIERNMPRIAALLEQAKELVGKKAMTESLKPLKAMGHADYNGRN